MNITKEVAEALGGEFKDYLNNTPEIQIYANHNLNEYQWRDLRYEEFSYIFENESYVSRLDLYDGIIKYLKNKI